MAKKPQTKKRKRTAWKTQAQQSDRHELYEKSVQPLFDRCGVRSA